MTRIKEMLATRIGRVRKEDEGFTLIELLVVVIIIGILAAIAIPIYIGVQNQAKDSAVKTDLGNAKIAAVASFTNTGAYPTAGVLTGLSSLGYTQSSTSNYSSTAGSAPTISLNTAGTAFCIQATSASGNTWAVSDSLPLQQGTCSAGVLTAEG